MLVDEACSHSYELAAKVGNVKSQSMHCSKYCGKDSDWFRGGSDPSRFLPPVKSNPRFGAYDRNTAEYSGDRAALREGTWAGRLSRCSHSAGSLGVTQCFYGDRSVRSLWRGVGAISSAW